MGIFVYLWPRFILLIIRVVDVKQEWRQHSIIKALYKEMKTNLLDFLRHNEIDNSLFNNFE